MDDSDAKHDFGRQINLRVSPTAFERLGIAAMALGITRTDLLRLGFASLFQCLVEVCGDLRPKLKAPDRRRMDEALRRFKSQATSPEESMKSIRDLLAVLRAGTDVKKHSRVLAKRIEKHTQMLTTRLRTEFTALLHAQREYAIALERRVAAIEGSAGRRKNAATADRDRKAARKARREMKKAVRKERSRKRAAAGTVQRPKDAQAETSIELA